MLEDEDVTNLNFGKYSKVLLVMMWLASSCLLPIILLQGYRVRQAALRLPNALAPDSGRFGRGAQEVMIVGVGDSVITGTGIRVLSDSITARVAHALAERFSVEVNWRSCGINGGKLEDVLKRVKEEPLPVAEIYLVSIGVNDVTGLTSLVRWQKQVVEFVNLLDEKALILMLGVPPMQRFLIMPSPLRQVFGIRAALLDKTLRRLAETVERIVWFDASAGFDIRYLAQDGYHPNELACVEIASKIVDALALLGKQSKSE